MVSDQNRVSEVGGNIISRDGFGGVKYKGGCAVIVELEYLVVDMGMGRWIDITISPYPGHICITWPLTGAWSVTLA